MTGKLSVRHSYEQIMERVAKAARKANRNPKEIRIMAVTKTVEVEKIIEAVECGVTLLGENRVQEFLGKYDSYPEPSKAQVHFIGSLQSNKVKQIIDKVAMIQSVDSLKLAIEIDNRAKASGKIADILLEVNIADEASKGGIKASELDEMVSDVGKLTNLRLRGLMTIPPFGDGKRYFAQMQRLFEGLRVKSEISTFDTLSMGMSGDFEDAIAHGATIVRIGSALFGKRLVL